MPHQLTDPKLFGKSSATLKRPRMEIGRAIAKFAGSGTRPALNRFWTGCGVTWRTGLRRQRRPSCC